MKTKVQKNNRVDLYHIMLMLVGIVTLFPVACDYILDGGVVMEWIGRVEEIASGFRSGQLYLYPTAETLADAGVKGNAMNSNFWFLASGLLYRLSGNIVLTYRVGMLAVQGGTLAASALLFNRIFGESKTKLPVFLGVLLYMTCPYRIYICYDLADFSQAVAWMLLPLYVWAVLGAAEREKKWSGIAAAFILAGLGYADTVYFLIVAGVTVLAGLAVRKFWAFVPVAAGSALFLPGLYRLGQYLFLDGFREYGIPVGSIMRDGYRLGEFFSSYFFRDGHPGMGLGMFLCLLTGLWMRFVGDSPAWVSEAEAAEGSSLLTNAGGRGQNRGRCGIAVMLSVLFTVLSFYYFPWELFQRMGDWSLKLISLIRTPAVFWGLACFCLCVPAAYWVTQISRKGNKLIAFAVPVIVTAVCIGICVYQCNTLTYNRMPLL